MDYYQSVVMEYLRADRAVFINTECCIQLVDSPNPDTSGLHWYCDAIAVNLRDKEVLLCEVTYAKGLTALLKRLRNWSSNWPELRKAIVRDCKIDPTWAVRPWIFAPRELLEKYSAPLCALKFDGVECRTKYLEDIQPWKFRSWDRVREVTASQKVEKQEAAANQ
jgi:hypothetical protein